MSGRVVDVCGGRPAYAAPYTGPVERTAHYPAGKQCLLCPSSSSWWGRARSAPRSPPCGCSLRTSAPRRSSGRTRSASSSWRCRSATGSAGAWPTAIPNMRALCLVAAHRRGAARDRARSRRTRSSTWRWTRSTRSPPARSSARCSPCSCWSPCRCSCSARSRPGRSGSRSSRWRRPAPWPGACTRSPPPGSLVGTLLSALVLIPLVGTRRTFLIFALAIAVVAVLGPAARCGAGRSRPAAIAALIALPVGTLKADDRGRRPRDPRGRDASTSTRG